VGERGPGGPTTPVQVDKQSPPNCKLQCFGLLCYSVLLIRRQWHEVAKIKKKQNNIKY